jgi:hypothetical protein
VADAELARLSPLFDTMYSERGRPSIPLSMDGIFCALRGRLVLRTSGGMVRPFVSVA